MPRQLLPPMHHHSKLRGGRGDNMLVTGFSNQKTTTKVPMLPCCPCFCAKKECLYFFRPLWAGGICRHSRGNLVLFRFFCFVSVLIPFGPKSCDRVVCVEPDDGPSKVQWSRNRQMDGWESAAAAATIVVDTYGGSTDVS
jgi:hypothetical protein